MLKKLLLISVLAVSQASHAEELKELMFQALTDGSASGEVTGEVRDTWVAVTKSNSPIVASIKRIKQFKEKGCGRIEVTLGQENVENLLKERVPMEGTVQFNLCSDGSAPAEGVDITRLPEINLPQEAPTLPAGKSSATGKKSAKGAKN